MFFLFGPVPQPKKNENMNIENNPRPWEAPGIPLGGPRKKNIEQFLMFAKRFGTFAITATTTTA